jgi:hypothetical protein
MSGSMRRPMRPDPIIALTRAAHQQSQFDADVAAALVRILRGEERGIARGITYLIRNNRVRKEPPKLIEDLRFKPAIPENKESRSHC